MVEHVEHANSPVKGIQTSLDQTYRGTHRPILSSKKMPFKQMQSCWENDSLRSWVSHFCQNPHTAKGKVSLESLSLGQKTPAVGHRRRPKVRPTHTNGLMSLMLGAD